MWRPFKTILLIIMLFISASGLPLYADTVNLDFNFNLPNAIISSKDESINIDYELTAISASHHRLNLFLDEKSPSLAYNEENPINLSFYFLGNKIADFQPTDIEVTEGDIVSYGIDLSQENLDIPNGDYNMEIQVSLGGVDGNISLEKIPISFHTNIDYISPLPSIARNETALTLFFPDNNFKHLIPITRTIPYTNLPLRSTLDNLALGPDGSLGLPQDSPIPPVQRLNLSRGIANVYLSKEIGLYEEYSSMAKIALDSFVYSLTSIAEVQGVQFYFDNRILREGFHGNRVDRPLYPYDKEKFYIAYISQSKRALLLPMNMSDFMPSDISIEGVFNGLKYSGGIIPYTSSIQPPVPEQVEILNYSLEGTNLQLQLNPSFIEVYRDKPDFQKLMVDSIVYTFASLDNIESVEFQLVSDNNYISEHIPLFKPVSPSQYINPEL